MSDSSDNETECSDIISDFEQSSGLSSDGSDYISDDSKDLLDNVTSISKDDEPKCPAIQQREINIQRNNSFLASLNLPQIPKYIVKSKRGVKKKK